MCLLYFNLMVKFEFQNRIFMPHSKFHKHFIGTNCVFVSCTRLLGCQPRAQYCKSFHRKITLVSIAYIK